MIRLEKSSEAYSIIYDLERDVKNGNTDDIFIQALVHCYKVEKKFKGIFYFEKNFI